MTKYLIALFIITLGTGYMYYDMTHPADVNKEIAAIKADKTPTPDSWGKTVDDSWRHTNDGGLTEVKKQDTFVKTFTDRPPQEEEVQEQSKTETVPEPQPEPVPLPDKKAENDIPPMPPELNPGQEKNWEALQRHKQQEAQQEPQAQEPELDGGPPAPPVEEAPPPPVRYGQYPCSYPDCPGNPDVQAYLGRRLQWETPGPWWYGSGGPNGIEVQAPFFSLHIPPRRVYRYNKHWRRYR